MANGDGAERERKLMCPFLDSWCIEERCGVYDKLVRVVGGRKQEMGICGFKATNAILSEINTVLHQQRVPVPKLEVPKLFRG